MSTSSKKRRRRKYRKRMDGDWGPMSIPKTREVFFGRFEYYRHNMSARKEAFNISTLDGYYRARKFYYEALRAIFFVTVNHSFLEEIGIPIPDLFESHKDFKIEEGYLKKVHEKNIRTLIVNLRKVAESCLFLNKIKEAEEICDIIFDICERVHEEYIGANDRVLFLTYAVKSQIEIIRKNYDKAEEYFNIGKGLESDSTTLKNLGAVLKRIRKCQTNGKKIQDFRGRCTQGFDKELYKDYDQFVEIFNDSMKCNKKSLGDDKFNPDDFRVYLNKYKVFDDLQIEREEYLFDKLPSATLVVDYYIRIKFPKFLVLANNFKKVIDD